ncbi:hypothetical protein BN2475_90093 [Paraburkholderia ribeironis]|uniref:Uncharacterized protein n=1 Tax=Paraburkholderia ribeironis TaxID=1247936 RepID=A0A1N7RN98_9BURK|nr:hypothetical protein BN2475_90093 [Paraburkholderia ribeironis]
MNVCRCSYIGYSSQSGNVDSKWGAPILKKHSSIAHNC